MLCSRVMSNIDTPTMTFKPGFNMFFVGFFLLLFIFLRNTSNFIQKEKHWSHHGEKHVIKKNYLQSKQKNYQCLKHLQLTNEQDNCLVFEHWRFLPNKSHTQRTSFHKQFGQLKKERENVPCEVLLFIIQHISYVGKLP